MRGDKVTKVKTEESERTVRISYSVAGLRKGCQQSRPLRDKEAEASTKAVEELEMQESQEGETIHERREQEQMAGFGSQSSLDP